MSGWFEDTVLNKSTSASDAAYLRSTSVTDFLGASGAVISGDAVSSWNGSVSLVNGGHCTFSRMTLGNLTTGCSIVSDDDTPGVVIPYSSRQGVFVDSSTFVYGSVTLASLWGSRSPPRRSSGRPSHAWPMGKR